MRKIGKQEIDDIAVGAALLGTGGGGDPYIGKLMALQAIEEHGPVDLLTIDEVPDDALVVPVAMMGAPTVMVEKIPGGNEAATAFSMIEQVLGQKVYATMPIEAGGVNSLLPFALAAQAGLPVIDADGMGRAFPEVQMVTFFLDGISATPMAIADEKGNSSVLNTIDGRWAERIARSITVQMGGSIMATEYPMSGHNVKQSGIHHILKLEEDIGKSLRLAKQQGLNPIHETLKITGGYQLFKGKVADLQRKTESGFARGTCLVEGSEENSEDVLELKFQNEHLLASTKEKLLCVTPDLIAVLDEETGLPITTEGLRYGQRCVVIGIPCDDKWRTDKGIEIAGPGYFGYDADYVPVEQLVRRDA